jgi:hypothetical protein
MHSFHWFVAGLVHFWPQVLRHPLYSSYYSGSPLYSWYQLVEYELFDHLSWLDPDPFVLLKTDLRSNCL